MGANASSTRQKLHNAVKNELGIDFDVDQETRCKMSVDQSQLMENISIKGSKNVELKQLSDVQNTCYSTSVANLDIFSQLAADTQNDIMQSLQQEGGIGINISDTSVDVLNEIDNKVNVGLKVKAAKDCLSQVQAPQVMAGIKIEDAMNINLSQESSNFNKCILDTVTEMAQTNGIELESTNKVKQEVTQKGWDPIASLSGLVGTSLLLAFSPIVISVVIVVISSAVGGGSSGGPGAPPAPPGEEMTGLPDLPTQAGGALGKLLGIGSRKGRRLIYLAIKVVLFVVILWFLYKLIFKYTTGTVEKYHTPQHTQDRAKLYLAKPLVLRQQYHHPHVSEDIYPLPHSEIPAYVQRWY